MISTPTNSTTSTIQKIYDISRDVFAAATPGFVPPPSDVERLTGFLGTLHIDLFTFLSMMAIVLARHFLYMCGLGLGGMKGKESGAHTIG
jgi:hypothetical protein